jgi:hypothetical protein
MWRVMAVTALADFKDVDESRRGRRRYIWAALRGGALVGGGAVDGWDLSAHGAQVRRELASMMDGIEEDEPEKSSYRLFRRELAAIVELRDLVPGRFVHLGNSIDEFI